MGEKRLGEKRHAKAVSAFVVCLMLFSFSAEAWSATITSWGWDSDDQVTSTPTGTDFTDIAGGFYHSLALKADGSLISWGRDGDNQVTDTPLDTNFTAIAAGRYHSMALSVSAVAVPLPASAWMGLALLGGMGVVGVMRRRMRSA